LGEWPVKKITDKGGPLPSVGLEIAVGAAWMLLARLFVRAIGIVSTVFLARLLVPEDFGLIALSTSIVFAIEVFGQLGIDMTLIRERHAGRAQYDTAWTLMVIKGSAVALMITLLAEPVANLFDDVRLANVIYVLAGAIAIDAVQNVGIVDFRKELRFAPDFVFTVAQKLASFIVTVISALLWRNYWAIVAGIVMNSLAGTVLSYAVHGYRPRFRLSEWKPLLGFSRWLLINNVLSFYAARLDVFIIGRYFGAHDLGIFRLSSEIAALPATELVAPLQRAIYPGITKIAGSTERLRASYTKGLAVNVMLAAPIAAGIAILAGPIVSVLLGPRWVDAVPLLQILALNSLVRLNSANTGAFLLALNRPELAAKLTTNYVIVLFPSFALGIWLGALAGAAAAMLAATSFHVVQLYMTVLRNLSVTAADLFRFTWRTWLSTAVMAGCVHLAATWTGASSVNSSVALVFLVMLGGVSFSCAHVFLWYVSGRPIGAESVVWDAAAFLCRGRHLLRHPAILAQRSDQS
jgi:lipopolysaccharide exporter